MIFLVLLIIFISSYPISAQIQDSVFPKTRIRMLSGVGCLGVNCEDPTKVILHPNICDFGKSEWSFHGDFIRGQGCAKNESMCLECGAYEKCDLQANECSINFKTSSDRQRFFSRIDRKLTELNKERGLIVFSLRSKSFPKRCLTYVKDYQEGIDFKLETCQKPLNDQQSFYIEYFSSKYCYDCCGELIHEGCSNSIDSRPPCPNQCHYRYI